MLPKKVLSFRKSIKQCKKKWFLALTELLEMELIKEHKHTVSVIKLIINGWIIFALMIRGYCNQGKDSMGIDDQRLLW